MVGEPLNPVCRGLRGTTDHPLKTLAPGGYGIFGARICRGLATDPSIQWIIGGRELSRAPALAGKLGSGAEGIAVDRAAPDFSNALCRLGVELLIHAAGPFQHQSYDVALAAANSRAHYVDLAGGRRFVCDFPAALDAPFRAAGCIGVTGASAVPALFQAVVEELTRQRRAFAVLAGLRSCLEVHAGEIERWQAQRTACPPTS